jgi:hypothetical protein
MKGMTPTKYGRVAAAIFALEAIFPIAHRLAGARYPGTTYGHTLAIDVGLAVIWIAAAVGGMVQRRSWAFFAMCVGAMASLIHGHMFSVVLSSHGPYGVALPFLVAFVVQMICIVRAAPAFRESVVERAGEEREASWLDRVRAAFAVRPRHQT